MSSIVRERPIFSLLLIFSIILKLDAFLAEDSQDLEKNKSCIVDGQRYRHGERIPRTHVCHVCICNLGIPNCAWMDCPPPPKECAEYTVEDHCNPTLYVCPIPAELAGGRYKRGLSKRLKRGSDLEPSELEENDNNHLEGDCTVLGVPYKTGDLMGVATGPCLECRCGKRDLYCTPRCCFRPYGVNENPNAIVRLLSQRGPRLPAEHPLEYLRTNH